MAILLYYVVEMFNKKGGVFYHPLMLYFFNQFQCMAIIFSSLEGW